MRLQIDLSSNKMNDMIIDVEYNMKVEDLATLISVKNTHLDFDLITLYFKGTKLEWQNNLRDYLIRDSDTIVLKL